MRLPLIKKNISVQNEIYPHCVAHFIIITMQPGVNNFSNVIIFIITQQQRKMPKPNRLAMYARVTTATGLSSGSCDVNCDVWLISILRDPFSIGLFHWSFPQTNVQRQKVEASH